MNPIRLANLEEMSWLCFSSTPEEEWCAEAEAEQQAEAERCEINSTNERNM